MTTRFSKVWLIWGGAILLALGAGLGGRLVWEDRSGNGALIAADLGGPFSLVTHTRRTYHRS